MDNRNSKIKRVLIIILGLNLAVAAAKLIVGFKTKSNAMIADGVHSSLDGMSNVIGLVGIAFAAQPADKDHPYGHRRFETLASMVIGAMLMFTAFELVSASISNLKEGAVPEISLINFITMIVTLIINFTVSFIEKRQGKKLRSELLIADSQHTKSDIFVSSVVIIGLLGVRFGFPWADSIASLFVVVLIGITAIKVLRDAAAILIDRATIAETDIISAISSIAGIEKVQSVRSRGPVDEFYIDLAIKVSSVMTINQMAALSKVIREKLTQAYAGLKEVQIEFLPGEAEGDFISLARAQADALHLGIHEVVVSSTDTGFVLDLHIEVPHDLSVQGAHDLVTEFEKQLMAESPEIDTVVSHIEPLLVKRQAVQNSAVDRIEARIEALLESEFPDLNQHDLRLMESGQGFYSISMHTQFPSGMSIEEAHQIIEKVEIAIRTELEMIDRVTIHVEPNEDESP